MSKLKFQGSDLRLTWVFDLKTKKAYWEKNGKFYENSGLSLKLIQESESFRQIKEKTDFLKIP